MICIPIPEGQARYRTDWQTLRITTDCQGLACVEIHQLVELTPEIQAWLDENAKSEWRTIGVFSQAILDHGSGYAISLLPLRDLCNQTECVMKTHPPAIEFESKADATLFKLTWAGES